MSPTVFFNNLIGEKKIHIHCCISLSTGSEKIFTSNIWYIHYVMYVCGEGNGTPLQYSCLENPMDEGAW